MPLDDGFRRRHAGWNHVLELQTLVRLEEVERLVPKRRDLLLRRCFGDVVLDPDRELALRARSPHLAFDLIEAELDEPAPDIAALRLPHELALCAHSDGRHDVVRSHLVRM